MPTFLSHTLPAQSGNERNIAKDDNMSVIHSHYDCYQRFRFCHHILVLKGLMVYTLISGNGMACVLYLPVC